MFLGLGFNRMAGILAENRVVDKRTAWLISVTIDVYLNRIDAHVGGIDADLGQIDAHRTELTLTLARPMLISTGRRALASNLGPI